MNGFEAINQANGWSIAFLGAGIVFSGLVILSTAISQLKKVIAFLESKLMNGKVIPPPTRPKSPKKFIRLPAVWPNDIREAAKLYRPLFEQLGSPFQLADLYRLSGENNYPHPHLTIKHMREAEIIIPTGDGSFSVTQ
ncbi:MAG: OadG family protein [Pseudomonadota bacterium]